MIIIETKIKSGVFPGEPDSRVTWMFVKQENMVIANLPIPANWSWTKINEWAQNQIDLYLNATKRKQVYV